MPARRKVPHCKNDLLRPSSKRVSSDPEDWVQRMKQAVFRDVGDRTNEPPDRRTWSNPLARGSVVFVPPATVPHALSTDPQARTVPVNSTKAPLRTPRRTVLHVGTVRTLEAKVWRHVMARAVVVARQTLKNAIREAEQTSAPRAVMGTLAKQVRDSPAWNDVSFERSRNSSRRQGPR